MPTVKLRIIIIILPTDQADIIPGPPIQQKIEKPKEQISKRVLKENKAYQIFQKRNISYTLKRTQALFSCNTRFEIHLFALLPTICSIIIVYHYCVKNMCYVVLGKVCFELTSISFAQKQTIVNLVCFFFNIANLTTKNKSIIM